MDCHHCYNLHVHPAGDAAGAAVGTVLGAEDHWVLPGHASGSPIAEHTLLVWPSWLPCRLVVAAWRVPRMDCHHCYNLHVHPAGDGSCGEIPNEGISYEMDQCVPS